MALFNNEPDKPAQPIKPQINPVPSPAAPMPERTIDSSSSQMASSQGTAYLDRGTKIAGKLHFEGPARIDGEVDGELHGKSLTIGESATVTAQIVADSVIVCGKVKGEISASQRIEIRATARVNGNITAPKLIIHEGAIFDGQCAMESNSAPERKSGPQRIERNGSHSDSAASA